jgi:hypothetical protein
VSNSGAGARGTLRTGVVRTVADSSAGEALGCLDDVVTAACIVRVYDCRVGTGPGMVPLRVEVPVVYGRCSVGVEDGG